jgi:hypothetical protein
MHSLIVRLNVNRAGQEKTGHSRRDLGRRVACGVLCLSLYDFSAVRAEVAQQPDPATMIQRIDAAVHARYQTVLAFTAIEHYAVFRGKDQTHPVAEMTVKDSYRKDVGKTYTVLSQSGSELVLRVGLKPLLENERIINQPGNVQRSWFNSANYEMDPKPGSVEKLNGRNCILVAVAARRKAPNTINGNIWVDQNDYSLVQIQGVATKSPSAFAGTTHMMRQYEQIDGFSMATHARAESNSLLFGRTVVTIDYSDYHLELDPHK